ncbi:BrnT family toxin [Aureimonas sp. AU12]|uniref:BrnT family toxin n=1 Tax=Aureimonas sp. AU12 TaxID=1638161 RepID=UPI001FCD463E|nr:BrnT family toxin [Aureimonas sp. AU12]
MAERGLDFADAPGLFADRTLTPADERFDYGEPRLQIEGFLEARVVMVVWTPRATCGTSFR